jgi:F-type H+-transporting ATPase subunit epsilon
MAATYTISLLTPEKTVLSAEVVSLIAPGSQGFLGVLANHAPLITALAPGPLTLRHPDGREQIVSVSGGFMEVSRNRAVVLADAVERPEEIDVERARAAAGRARQRLKQSAPELDVPRAEAALRRALNRMRVADRWAGM